MDVRSGSPRLVSYDNVDTSENRSPVFASNTVRLTAKKVGVEAVTFQLVHVKNKKFYNTAYGTATINVQVICSHKYDEGVVIQEASALQNEIIEYTCRVCKEKMTKEILPPVEARVENYVGDYDGGPHSIGVIVTKPATGAIIKFGTEEGVYDLDTPPEYTNAGTYNCYYNVTADGYSDTAGQAVITINKTNPMFTPPSSKSLTSNGTEQELVNAGSAEGGTLYYALGTETGATAPYTASIPTVTDAGIYYVWYKVVGDDNHNDLIGDYPIKVTVDYADMSATLQPDGSIDLTNAPSNTQYVYAASYDSDGRMTGVFAGILRGNTVTFYVSGKVVAGNKLFLLDENHKPLCPKLTVE